MLFIYINVSCFHSSDGFSSACLYSVNPFSTLFSANIQQNCPILLYMPNLLTSRTSTSFFLPSFSFERLSYFQRFILQNHKMKSAGIMTLMLDHLCDWFPELCRLQPQLYFIQLQHQFQLLLLCSDTGKNIIENYFRVLRKKKVCFA